MTALLGCIVPPSRTGNSGVGVGLGKGVDVGREVAVGSVVAVDGTTVAVFGFESGLTEEGEQATIARMKKMLTNKRFMVFLLSCSGAAISKIPREVDSIIRQISS
jgi:hypothetical protein